MATPKKKKPHTFLYQDGTYITYELTREDYETVAHEAKDEGTAIISIGLINLKGIRSVIEQREVELDNEEAEINDGELPVLDQESYNWIKQYMGGKD